MLISYWIFQQYSIKKEQNLDLDVKLQVVQIEESVATLSSTLEEAQKVHSDLLQVQSITSSGRQ